MSSDVDPNGVVLSGVHAGRSVNHWTNGNNDVVHVSDDGGIFRAGILLGNINDLSQINSAPFMAERSQNEGDIQAALGCGLIGFLFFAFCILMALNAWGIRDIIGAWFFSL